MDATRKLGLIVVMTAAFMVMAASSAMAGLYVEGNGPCPAIVAGDHSYTGGCLFTAASPAGSPVELRGIFGVMALCDNVFTARLNGNGEGYIYNQVLRTPGTPNPCAIQPKLEADGHAVPWPIELVGENACGAGCDALEVVFSLTGPWGPINNCHLTGLELRQSSHFTASAKTNGTTHKFCENDSNNAVMGTWNVVSPAPGVEVE